MLEALGLIWDLQRPPANVLAGPLVADLTLDRTNEVA
jgi:hypothetical protein